MLLQNPKPTQRYQLLAVFKIAASSALLYKHIVFSTENRATYSIHSSSDPIQYFAAPFILSPESDRTRLNQVGLGQGTGLTGVSSDAEAMGVELEAFQQIIGIIILETRGGNSDYPKFILKTINPIIMWKRPLGAEMSSPLLCTSLCHSVYKTEHFILSSVRVAQLLASRAR